MRSDKTTRPLSATVRIARYCFASLQPPIVGSRDSEWAKSLCAIPQVLRVNASRRCNRFYIYVPVVVCFTNVFDSMNMCIFLNFLKRYIYDLTLTRSLQQFKKSVYGQQNAHKITRAIRGRQKQNSQKRTSATLTFPRFFIQFSVSLVWNYADTRHFSRSLPIFTQRLSSLSILCS